MNQTNSEAPQSAPSAYRDILKSSSIVGGSQAITYVIRLIRTKLVALLLGPTGVGMVGLFQSSIGLVAQMTNLGIASSGVRQIASAYGSDDLQKVARTANVLKRMCWVTGVFGWVVTLVLSRPLSIWAFESSENSWLLALLGASLFFSAVSGGQKALIQGRRQITDLAWMSVISGILSTIVAVAIYAVLGERGIVPVLIATAAINLAVSSWFVKKISIPQTKRLSWSETTHEGKQLASLGLAFMWGGLLAALVDLGVRSLLVREIGLQGVGIYQAAWAVSGLFANFILQAMGTDFYPRLSEIKDNHSLINSTINEQTEIGILIALPGLLATFTLGPLIMVLLYSADFIEGATLLPWFVLGIFFRVFSWPIGFSILAKGESAWFFLTQTVFYATQFLIVWLLVESVGMVATGIAFIGAYIPATLLNLFNANRLTGFKWSRSASKMLVGSAVMMTVSFCGAIFLPKAYNMTIGSVFTVIASVLSVRGLTQRVGRDHRLIRYLLKIPFVKFVLSGVG